MNGKSLDAAPRQEVSCKVARMILKFAELSGVAPEKLLKRTGRDLPYLLDTSKWTDEEVVATLLENLSFFMRNYDAPLMAGKNPEALAEDEFFDLMFGACATPAIFLRLLPRWFNLHIKSLDLSLIQEGPSAFTYQVAAARRSRPIPTLILRWLEGMLSGAVSVYGFGEPQVTFTPPTRETSRQYRVEVNWEGTGKLTEATRKPLDDTRAELILKRLLRRFEKVDEKKADLTRVSTLLEESEGRFHNLFENVSDPIFIINDGGYIVEVNRKALELMLCRKEQLIGLPAAKLVDPDNEENLGGLLKLARLGRPLPLADLELRRPDASRLKAQVNLTSTVWPETGTPLRILMLVRPR